MEFLRELESIVKDLKLPDSSEWMLDCIREIETLGKMLNKSQMAHYFPEMSKKVRLSILRTNRLEYAMTRFFFLGIILLALFSAFNFLRIDLITPIRLLF